MVRIYSTLLQVYKGKLIRSFCSRKKDGYFFAENLRGRSLLLVSGKDSGSLLQRLITNDINKLDGQNKSIFTIFLNNKGKVLHDAIIYRYKDDYLLEVESKAVLSLKIHLKLLKESRTVDVKNMEDILTIWAIYGEGEEDLYRLRNLAIGADWFTSMDPRLEQLGLKIIGPKKSNLISYLQKVGFPVALSQQKINQFLRYQLGIAEGLSEVPLGRCSISEINADYLSAVCPKKTDYIGWNPNILSDVYSRRIFPLHFEYDIDDTLPMNSPIQDVKGKKKSPIGYLCGHKKNVGIAFICLSEISNQVRICVNHKSIVVNYSKPFWWPQ